MVIFVRNFKCVLYSNLIWRSLLVFCNFCQRNMQCFGGVFITYAHKVSLEFFNAVWAFIAAYGGSGFDHSFKIIIFVPIHVIALKVSQLNYFEKFKFVIHFALLAFAIFIFAIFRLNYSQTLYINGTALIINSQITSGGYFYLLKLASKFAIMSSFAHLLTSIFLASRKQA